MTYKKAVFLDFASIHPDDLDVGELLSTAEQWVLRKSTNSEQVGAVIADADVVITNKVVLKESHFIAAKKLKLVCAAATGVNNIDLIAARAANVDVCNVRSYATPAVVQHVFMMLLSLVTNMKPYQRDVLDGGWSKSEFFCLLNYPVRELDGLTLGIIGYGELGQAVANVAKAFGMKVLIAKRNTEDDRAGHIAIDDLLPQVDVLSLHCPLTQANKGLIGEAELALMKPDAILLNTARGGLVDEKALLNALKNNKLAGAGLDVLEQEPPAANHPLLLAKLDNLIITPHTAWASRQARQRLVDEIAKNIAVYSKGEKRHCVN